MQDDFLKTPTVSRSLLLTNSLLAILYLLAIAFLFPISNIYLFWILIITEIYHLWLAGSFWFTLWNIDKQPAIPVLHFTPAVDVFITVCGEPLEIVEQTARAARDMKYPNFRVFLLNDGLVAKKDNWQEVELLAKRLEINYITRTVVGGAKAGNINNALRLTSSDFFVVFDADHIPHPDFLQKTMPYFADPKMALVQTPQYYRNKDQNYITAASWEQQEIFFGPIMHGKNRSNSVFMCGTNMVLSRAAILEVGGFNEKSITEDFLTSLYIHKNGWKTSYHPEILAEGLAPEDFLSYYKQQYRWGRGSLELMFKHNPLFTKGLTFSQRVQYLSSSSYWISGVVVLLNAVMPVVFFYTGQRPFDISTMVLAAIFLPYIFLTLYTLSVATNFSYTYRAVAFSMGQFPIHIKALFSILTGKQETFKVTSKTAIKGNYLYLVTPHITYVILALVGIGVAVAREGLSAAVITNVGWALISLVVFTMFITAALPESQKARQAREVRAVKPIQVR